MFSSKLFFQLVLLLVFLFGFFLLANNVHAQSHPFLIVKSTEYLQLRNRASLSPWKEMKQSAINDCNSLNFLDETDENLKSYKMRDISSACSLAYILDPGNKNRYVNKLLSEWNHLSEIRRIQTLGDNARHRVPPGIAVFNTILALDIIHNELTSSQISSLESQLKIMVDHYITKTEKHPPSAAGLLGLWAIYKGNRADIDKYKSMYKSQLLAHFSSDGVFLGGTGYAGARFAGVRDTKAQFKDILEYTGEDNTYYSEPKLKNFYEWFYGHASAPFNKHSIFGDSAAFFGLNDLHKTYAQNRSAHIGNAYRHSSQAAKWASWRNGGRPLHGRLLNYVLMGQALPSPELPGSRIYPDSGAFFQIKNAKPEELYAAFWNKKAGGGHQHKDTNALYLAGYGEILLNNVGYYKFGQSWSGFSWNYVHNRAVSSNTVLINYSIGDPKNPSTTNDHQSKTGKGITKGFTSEGFDFALGNSGSALPNGKHLREFLFVHPQNGINGYFVTIDKITPNSSSAKANIAFHPYSDSLATIAAKKEYQSITGPNKLTQNQAGISVFYATVPEKVDIIDGLIADYEYSIVGKYLFATFPLGSANQEKQIVSVLYPFDKNHTKASLTRVLGTNYSGVKITSSGSTDYALESNENIATVPEGASFKGSTSLFRFLNGKIDFYFAENSSRFYNQNSVSFGYTSDSATTAYVNRSGKGSIISPGTNVAFYYPGIKNVKLNGQTLPNISSDSKSVKVFIKSGTHTVELVGEGCQSGTVPGDANGDCKVDGFDYVFWWQNFGKDVGGGASEGDFDEDGKVDGFDYVIWWQNFGT